MLFLDLGRFLFLQVLLHALESAFDLDKVADDEIGFDVACVAKGIDRTDVRNGVIFESAKYVRKSVNVAEVGEEGGLFQRFLADGGNVGVLDLGVYEFARVEKLGETVEAIVGNGGDADVGFARIGEGAIGNVRLGENLEQRCFADLREAYDSSLHMKVRGSWSVDGGS